MRNGTKPHSIFQSEIFRFAVSGCMAVTTDFWTYRLLVDEIRQAPAKGVSFLLGMIVAFFLNKFWTFEKQILSKAEFLKFLGLYTTSMGANISVNSLILHNLPHAVGLAFLTATGTSTILNFLGQKFWVFK